MRTLTQITFVLIGTLVAISAVATETKLLSPCANALSEHQRDFRSDWGYQFLFRDDPVFRDPMYLRALQNLAVPAITNFEGRGRIYLKNFTEALERLTNGQVLEFTVSGTAANNLLFHYADLYLQRRRSPRWFATMPPPTQRATMLFLGSPYAGVSGRIKEMKDNSANQIVAPYVHPNISPTGLELANVIRQENQALENIIEKVTEEGSTVGAIFLEPVTVFGVPVRVYRPEFMLRLREVADHLKIGIFADEVMSGGGRTGHFWGYERYPGFTPDLLTFGKGLIVAGVFQPALSNTDEIVRDVPMSVTTTAQNPLVLLQATTILNVIHSRHLIENAATMGKLFYRKALAFNMAKIATDKKNDPRGATNNKSKYDEAQHRVLIETACAGLVCTAPNIPETMAMGYLNRYLPPLSIDANQINQIFNEPTP